MHNRGIVNLWQIPNELFYALLHSIELHIYNVIPSAMIYFYTSQQQQQSSEILPADLIHLPTDWSSYFAPTQLLSCSHHRTKTWKCASTRWTHDSLSPVNHPVATVSLLQEINKPSNKDNTLCFCQLTAFQVSLKLAIKWNISKMKSHILHEGFRINILPETIINAAAKKICTWTKLKPVITSHNLIN